MSCKLSHDTTPELFDYYFFLKGLGKKTEYENRFIALAESDVTKASLKTMQAIYRAHKAMLAVKEAIKTPDERKAEKERERKERTHRLVGLGGLVEKAGLSNRSDAQLLGAFLAIANVPDGDEKWQRWEAAGASAFVKKGDAEKSD